MTPIQSSPCFTLAPRQGKYYGTDILWGGHVIGAVWHHDDKSQPSGRELAYLGPGVTVEEFWANCTDEHWESQQNYEEALALLDRLNALHQHP